MVVYSFIVCRIVVVEGENLTVTRYYRPHGSPLFIFLRLNLYPSSLIKETAILNGSAVQACKKCEQWRKFIE